MRVLIAVPRLALPGGVASYYKSLRPFLDADKVYIEIGNTPEQHHAWGTIGRMMADYRKFARALRTNSFDLVHINPSLGWRSVIRDGVLLLLAKWHRHKVLVFFHGWDPGVEALIRRRFLRLFRCVYGRADGFVVLGDAFRQALVAMGMTAPIHRATTVASIPVSADCTSRAPSLPGDQEPAAEAKPFTILFLSRLDQGKGLVEAIEAFALLKRHMEHVALVVAGDGPERSGAEGLVRDRGIRGVRFVGHVDGAEKDLAFRSADAFLFPSSYGEGMPIAVLEAMAYGLPIVTRPVGGLRDFFETGVMGYSTDSSDPVSFAGLLDRLITDSALRHRIGQHNREYARSHFAAPIVARKLLDIYAQVADAPGSR
jgi:glycosyltransferase involved in cell wall biosynthesis